MYTNFIRDFHLHFPFTEFEGSMLRVLNIALPNFTLTVGLLSRV
jgi:hypothetical protein